MKNFLIITGGSKGIGKGIVEEYNRNGYYIFSISRSRVQDEKLKNIEQIQYDLANTEGIEKIMQEIFAKINKIPAKSVTLINNAGTLGNIGPIENNDWMDIQQAVNINFLAPAVLTSVFIGLTKNMSCKKLILNISSGAAEKAIFGWSLYCSTKAAMDMLTKTTGLEQNYDSNGVKIISVHPGVVDTQMQTEIRKMDKSVFKDVEKFIDLKESGALAEPGIIGSKIFKLESWDLSNGAIVDIRD